MQIPFYSSDKMLISGRGQKNLLQDRDMIFLFFFLNKKQEIK